MIAIVSRAYLGSAFCLNEMGAAISRRIAATIELHSFVVPPLRLEELPGAMRGMQCHTISDKNALDVLRKAITGKTSRKPKLSVWQTHCDLLLAKAAEKIAALEAEELSTKILLQDIRIDRNVDPKSTLGYKLKVRRALENRPEKTLRLLPSLIGVQTLRERHLWAHSHWDGR